MIKDSTRSLDPGFSICHIHAVSLSKNIEMVEQFIDKFSNKPEIICISKTRLNKHSAKKY